MPRGGKREGAGAKPRTSSPTKVHGVRFAEEEWNEITVGATLQGLTPSEYIRRKALS